MAKKKSAPKADKPARSRAARVRSATPSTKQCATGCRASSPRTTSSARSSARTRSRKWSAFQAVIGREARAQCLERIGRLPDHVIACVGGGSNAAGMFYPFVGDASVKLLGVEAGGRGAKLGQHASPLSYGQPGVLHGSMSYVMQDTDGQTADVHSISAGLDYPGVGPAHSYWKDAGRVEYTACEEEDAMAAFDLCSPPRRNSPRARKLPRHRESRRTRPHVTKRRAHSSLPLRPRR